MTIVRILYLAILLGVTVQQAVAEVVATEQQQLDDLLLTLTVEKSLQEGAEQFNYRLKVTTPREVVVTFQAVDETLGPFKIINRKPRGPIINKANEQQHSWQREYQLQPERIGELTIPKLMVEFYTTDKAVERTPCLSAAECPRLTAHDPGPEITFADTRREMYSEPVAVTVTVLPPEVNSDTELAATKPKPLVQMLSQQPWSWYLWLSMLLLAPPLVVYLAHRIRVKAQPTDVPMKTPVQERDLTPTLAEQSLAQLKQLQNQDLTTNLADVYQALDQTLRNYVSKRLSLTSLAQTSDELLDYVRSSPLAEHRDTLKIILQRCDLVKFAGQQPLQVESHDTLELAEQFILVTAEQ